METKREKIEHTDFYTDQSVTKIKWNGSDVKMAIKFFKICKQDINIAEKIIKQCILTTQDEPDYWFWSCVFREIFLLNEKINPTK